MHRTRFNDFLAENMLLGSLLPLEVPSSFSGTLLALSVMFLVDLKLTSTCCKAVNFLDKKGFMLPSVVYHVIIYVYVYSDHWKFGSIHTKHSN